MSAIWGIIDFSKQRISIEQKEQFADTYSDYAIDRMADIHYSHVLMGCGHQFLTQHANRDILPIYDKEREILFTCDAVLDNRDALLSKLPEATSEMGDGTLLYLAYLKWDKRVCEHLLGAYTFAVYHERTNECFLYTDHMSNRSLFYCFRDNVLYFSTLIVPLQKMLQSALSEKWIVSCLSNTSANIAIFEELTPFEGILQVMAASYICFSSGISDVCEYWSPYSIKQDRSISSEKQCEEIFLKIMQECVESQIPSTSQVGATLSGGLDSTTIASFAASFLDKEGRLLYSYTSVPLKDYKADPDTYAITDESQNVEAFCKMYPNIRPSFLACPGLDGFTPLAELMPHMGYPMKSAHNLTWLNEIYKKASSDGCRLMLKGQYGNFSISFGYALTVFYQLLLAGRWTTLYRGIRAFQRHYRVPMKEIFRFMWKEWRNERNPAPFPYEDSLVSADVVKKHMIPQALRQMQKNQGAGTMLSRSQRLNLLYEKGCLAQLSMFDTFMGLTHGLLIRDPSKDKRMIELCARIPVEYYIAGGLERGQVRSFMHDRIPDCILLDIYHRGLQSADNHFRILQNWTCHKEYLQRILASDLLLPYLDAERLQALLKDVSSEIEPTSHITRQANVLYSFALFLNCFERKPSDE